MKRKKPPSATPSFLTPILIRYFWRCLVYLFCLNPVLSQANDILGDFRIWHPVTISFDGPHTSEDASNNPFLNYRLQVEFVHVETGRRYSVPGYYAADGNAAQSSASQGRVWRVHFTPDAVGQWTYAASFREGLEVAVSSNPNAGSRAYFDGASGSFEITSGNGEPSDLRSRGLLKYVGDHYLQYAGSKEYFIKTGPNGPENLLAFSDFDGTYDTACKQAPIDNSLHDYLPHVRDWENGDPVWKNGLGKGLIGAINYLGETGLNSLYFLTYNTDGGDGCDVFPWITPSEKRRYDVSKLAQWDIVFSQMDKRGLLLHVVLSERQNAKRIAVEDENGGILNVTRQLYYRELIARFGYHLAVQWNLGEENTNNDGQRRSFANYIRDLDPYDHPITVHTSDRKAFTFYDQLLGHESFESTSLQASIEDYNALAQHYRKVSRAADRKWVVYADEQAPNAGNSRAYELRSKGLWGNLMGGGAGVEWYFSGDLSLEDFRKYDRLWADMANARQFFQNFLPFHNMQPAHQLTPAEEDYVFATPGEAYAVYIPQGGEVLLDLGGDDHKYIVRWFSPRTGNSFYVGDINAVLGGKLSNLGYPPFEPDMDWVVLLTADQIKEEEPPQIGLTPLYRVNAGGGGVQDELLDWLRDTKNKPVSFVNANSSSNKTSKKPYAGENNTAVPGVVFDKARWDPPALPEMQWDFPVEANQTYLVNLYFAETSESKNRPGKRIFNVAIEGAPVLREYDVVADVGYQVATVKSFQITTSDNNLDIDFMRVVGNPFVNAIEIVQAGDRTNEKSWRVKAGHTYGVISEKTPDAFSLIGNFPNPFTEQTTVTFHLPEAATLKVRVYDMLGRQVWTQQGIVVEAGFDRQVNLQIPSLPAGRYLYRINSDRLYEQATGLFVISH